MTKMFVAKRPEMCRMVSNIRKLVGLPCENTCSGVRVYISFKQVDEFLRVKMR